MFFVALDIAQLEQEGSPALFLGLNRFAPFSIRDCDYLKPGPEAIARKFHSLLREEGIEIMPARTFLITTPRVLGYVFNPVSFYISFDAREGIHSILAEVNNTFGERHAYLLKGGDLAREKADTALPVVAEFQKEFYVSPLLDRQGTYRLRLVRCAEDFEMHINLDSEGKDIFWASLHGRARKLDNLQLFRSALAFPLTAALTIIRIHLQAMILYFRRGAEIYPKPEPAAKGALRRRVGLVHRLRLYLMTKLPRLRSFISRLLMPIVLFICVR